MVKVVGQDQGAYKRITCRNCGAILEYLQNEVKSHHGTDYGGGPDGREWIVCAQCGKDVNIKVW